LKEKVIGALLAVSYFHLKAEKLQTPLEADIVVAIRFYAYGSLFPQFHRGRFLPSFVAIDSAKLR
jgi:hypothetical protein